jgi:hypothetical protein
MPSASSSRSSALTGSSPRRRPAHGHRRTSLRRSARRDGPGTGVPVRDPVRVRRGPCRNGEGRWPRQRGLCRAKRCRVQRRASAGRRAWRSRGWNVPRQRCAGVAGDIQVVERQDRSGDAARLHPLASVPPPASTCPIPARRTGRGSAAGRRRDPASREPAPRRGQATRSRGGAPAKKASRLSATRIPIAVRVSRVALPRCGSSTHWARPAAPDRPCGSPCVDVETRAGDHPVRSSADARSDSSTTEPRAVFIRIAVGFIARAGRRSPCDAFPDLRPAHVQRHDIDVGRQRGQRVVIGSRRPRRRPRRL